MNKIFFKAVAVMMPMMAVSVSCVEEQMNDAPVVSDVEFFAANESTRTGLNADMKTVEWKEGDQISILAGEDNLLYTASSAGASTGFATETAGVKTNAGSVWAVYPYSDNNKIVEGNVTVTVPSSHEVSAEGFAQDANVTVAYCSELKPQTQLSFKNVCSYLKVKLSQAQAVKKIVLSSDRSVAIAGEALVKMNASGEPEIVSVSEPVTSVELVGPDALDGTYLIPVLPGDAAKWTLAFTKTDGTESTVAIGSEAAPFVRNSPLYYDFTSADINWKVAPSAVTADKVFWSDAHVSWTHEGKVDAYKVYAEDQLVATVENGVKTAHLTGLANGTSYNIKVAAVYGAEEKVSEEIEITTGAITQLTKNVSPTSVAVEIENRAGVLKYNAETKITGPSIYVELYKGDDRTTPVYATYVLDKEKVSMGHPFFNSLVVSNSKTWAEDYPLNLAFGALEAGTDYWFRVRSAEDYTYSTYTANQYEMKTNSSKGVSEWSELVKLSTQPSHEATSDEVLFQGFDDCSMEHDFINCAVGIMPAFGGGSVTEAASTAGGKYPAMFAGWTNGWCFYGLRTNMKMTDIFNCGWLSQMTAAGEYKYYTVENITGKPCIAPAFAASVTADSRIGSMRTTMSFKGFTGWNFTNACYPHEGYMAMGSYYDGSDAVASRKAAIMTPALSDPLTDEETDVVLTFRALAVQGRTGVLGVYKHNGTKGAANWSEVTSLNIKNSNGVTENSSEWSAMNDTHKWYDYSVEFKMKKGDALGFGTDGNACICIDDICVKIK